MAPRLPNAKVPNTRSLLPSGAARANKYVPKAENSEFSITRITPQNALNLVRKFSDKELETQYSKREIEILHDEASKALRNEIINITGRDSEGNIANFNEKSIEWLLQNNSLIDRLAKSGSRDAQSLGIFRDVKIKDLERSNPELYKFYDANSWIRSQDGIYINNPKTHEWSRYPNVLTDPPKDLPKTEVDKANMLNEGNTPTFLIRGKETPLKEGVVMEDIPIIPAGEKSAAVSPSPEAIHEAMRDAVSKDGTVTVSPESIAKAEAAAKETEAKTPATKEAPKTETETKAATDKTDAKTPEITETPQGLLSRLGGHIGRNLGKYLLGGGIGTVGWEIINDLASKNSKLRSLFTGSDVAIEASNPSVTQPRVKSLDQREGAYIPERLLKFRQNTQEPFVNNTNVNVDTGGISRNEELPVQQQQQQVVNAPAPVNNATADYVRAAYNSYIPSDAGRAYQKAIYGDPLELDRMRLQQQQQKWRDFIMRSGQSPAELVQRGLMPYDALQYV